MVGLCVCVVFFFCFYFSFVTTIVSAEKKSGQICMSARWKLQLDQKDFIVAGKKQHVFKKLHDIANSYIVMVQFIFCTSLNSPNIIGIKSIQIDLSDKKP